jgi:hypothetical protein
MFGVNAFGWPYFAQAWSGSVTTTVPNNIVVTLEAIVRATVTTERALWSCVISQAVVRPTVSAQAAVQPEIDNPAAAAAGINDEGQGS